MKHRLLFGSLFLALVVSFDYPDGEMIECDDNATWQFPANYGNAGFGFGGDEPTAIAAAIEYMMDGLAFCPGCEEPLQGCTRHFQLEDKDGAPVDLGDGTGGGYRLDTTEHTSSFWTAGIDLRRGDVLTVSCTKCVSPLPDPE